jgi:hypothetical protein
MEGPNPCYRRAWVCSLVREGAIGTQHSALGKTRCEGERPFTGGGVLPSPRDQVHLLAIMPTIMPKIDAISRRLLHWMIAITGFPS